MISQSQFVVGQRHALRDQDLCLDDVDACHFLGHRVLDLDARIDLDKEELVSGSVNEELDRARVLIFYLLAN